MSKCKFIHTLSESESIFALEQKAIVKIVALLLGHPVLDRLLVRFVNRSDTM